MPSLFERILDDRQHRVVALRVEDIARADENLRLVCFGARLIETFGQIVKVERDEIDDALARDAQPLAFFQFE